MSDSIVSTALAVLGIGQARIYHRNDRQWAEIDYYLQVRHVHIDTLNNVREDLRDMYAMQGRKLDTGMIVATIMLTIGFGFVVEGTFPPKTSADNVQASEEQRPWRVAYAVVAGLALMCPFISVFVLLECRRRLDFFMTRFSHEFFEILKGRIDGFQQDTQNADHVRSCALSYTKGLPRDPIDEMAAPLLDIYCPSRNSAEPATPRLGQSWWAKPVSCCRRRSASKNQKRNNLLDAHNRSMPVRRCTSRRLPDLRNVPDMQLPLELHNDMTWWWEIWCMKVYALANIFGALGAFFNVLCCALLLGMYFEFNYSDTPAMWRSYVGVVLGGLLLGTGFLWLAWYRGPHAQGERTYRKQREAFDKNSVDDIPDWMIPKPDKYAAPELNCGI